MTEFTLPELGENVETATVSKVLVNVGDTVEKDQAVVELETDKATVEVPTTVAGVVKSVNVKAGEKVKVGASVLTFEDGGAGAKPPASAGTQEEQSTEEKVDAAASGGMQQNVAPIRRSGTDKAGTVDPASPEGRRAELAAVSKPAVREATEPASNARRQAEPRGPAAPAAPAARRLAREVGVDVNEVQGSGPEGRISRGDVKEHARRVLTSVGPSRAGSGPSARTLPEFEKWGDVERKAMSGIRRKTAEHLSYAWQTIPHVTQFEKGDITALEALRKRYSPQVEERGAKLTLTAILAKVLAVAVQQFPQFNASVDADAEEIIYKHYVNIGIAADTNRGLLVPVVKNADQKGIGQIAVEIQELSAKARDGKLSLDEMSGGSMTISNLGGIGGTSFTPIVNWPEVAILGVSRGAREMVERNGEFVPRLMLPLSLSYDHRVIDGADAMRFLRWVVDALEQPFLLAL